MIDERTNPNLTAEALLSEAIRFGQGLKDCPEYSNFLRAREEADRSAAAKRLREELLRARAAVQQAMNSGGNVSELLKTFQDKQQQFENLPEITRLIQAQRQLLNLLEAIARQISESAGIDFVEANAVQSSCCG